MICILAPACTNYMVRTSARHSDVVVCARRRVLKPPSTCTVATLLIGWPLFTTEGTAARLMHLLRVRALSTRPYKDFIDMLNIV